MVEGVDLREDLEPSARLLEPAEPQVELGELLERVALAGVDRQGRFEISGRALDIPVLEGVAAQADHRRRVPGIAAQVGAILLVGLVEPAILAELLGEPQPGLVEVRVALERGAIVPDHDRGAGAGAIADLVGPHVGLGVGGHQLVVTAADRGRLGEPVGGQIDAGELPGDQGLRLPLAGEGLAQDRLGHVDTAGTGLVDARQDLSAVAVEPQFSRQLGGLDGLGAAAGSTRASQAR